MPLPQKVVEQIGKEPVSTPGWSFGMLTFAGSLFFIVIFIYIGLTFGYTPYLNGQVAATQQQVSQLDAQISPAEQTSLINFYSQIANLKTLLASHVIASNLFPWLEQNTEPNVYYTAFSFASGDTVTIAAVAKTEADVNQQLAILENSPEVQALTVSGVSQDEGTGFAFTMNLTIDPALLTANPSSAATSTTPVTVSSTTQ